MYEKAPFPIYSSFDVNQFLNYLPQSSNVVFGTILGDLLIIMIPDQVVDYNHANSKLRQSLKGDIKLTSELCLLRKVCEQNCFPFSSNLLLGPRTQSNQLINPKTNQSMKTAVQTCASLYNFAAFLAFSLHVTL